MAVYVDQLFPTATSVKWPFPESCHLLTDGPIQELHDFARRLWLKPEWFQGHHVNSALHHYDLTKGKRFQALKLGAIELTDGQQFLSVLNRRVRKGPEPVRFVLIGQRYEYSILPPERGLYTVRCVDTGPHGQSMDHGPFTLEEANAMIDARIKRDDALKR